MKKEIAIGVLIVSLVAVGIIYVSYDEAGEKIRVDNDKATLYIFNLTGNNRWNVAGREYVSLFEGASKLNRDLKTIKVWEETDALMNISRVFRETTYIKGAIVLDRYEFNGNASDKEMFPISHKIIVFDGVGLFLRYEARELPYNGNTNLAAKTPLNIGSNIIISFQDNYNWAHIYQSGIFKVQYKVTQPVQEFNIRLFDPEIKQENVEYTFNSRKEKVGNKYNLLIGGQLYADSKGTKIEDAKSLKYCEFCDSITLSIKEDKDYPIEVIDYNFTSVQIKPEITIGNANKNIPIKVYTKGNESDVKSQQAIKGNLGKQPALTLPFGFDKVLKYGEHSTEVLISGAETGVLEDTYFDEDTTVSGADANLICDKMDGSGELPFIKFNISAIPSAATIVDTTIIFYSDVNSDENVDVWYVANQSWKEEEIDALCGDSIACPQLWNMLTTKIKTYNGDDISESFCYISGLQSAVQSELDISNTNVSFALNHTGDTTDFYFFASKEYATSYLRPVLNVTYEYEVLPSYSNFQNNNSMPYKNNRVNWSVDLSDNSLDYYKFAHNQSGTLVNVTSVDISGSSYTAWYNLTITANKGSYICGQFWFNDTLGNTNSTNLSCVTVQNSVPSFNESLTPQNIGSGQTFNYDVNCSDADSDSITYYDNSTLFDIVSATGVITDAPTDYDTGVYMINITCGDGYGNASQNFSYTITDITVPQLADFQVNDSTPPEDADVNWSISFTDGGYLDYAKFATNKTGTWGNVSSWELNIQSIGLNYTMHMNVLNGTYVCGKFWANDSYGNQRVSTTGCITVLNGTGYTPVNVSYSLNPSISEIIFQPNWSLINWSKVINATGNFTWNMTQYSILPVNGSDWTFNITNLNTTEGAYQMKINSTEEWYSFGCEGVALTTSYTNIGVIPASISKLINCTLNLLNISQTYINWTVAINRANWSSNYSFNTG